MPVELLLLLIIGGLIAFLIYLWRSKRPSSRSASPPPPTPQDPFAPGHETQGDPRTLKAGDMLDFGTERTWIRGTLRLSEGGYTWAEHFLEVDDSKRWLSVETDPDIQMVLWKGRPELELTPHSDTIDFEGVRYRLVERGSASYRSEGTTGLPAQGGMDYADYKGPNDAHLAFERFDHGRWEAATGSTVPNGSFTIYPGG
ncbi:DUF4178 domain-containing protein [Halostreptopolyspora alba]|uniref:DUF4178 domain-containing protein n=1 Tax=Halostreptopolyspora alba TaxID=2487137 RepID=A0A3N0E165_9ACTN|nr:DUF4178 domain-containing protein [Nocardiopsaceae bacterium YIM 96095]